MAPLPSEIEIEIQNVARAARLDEQQTRILRETIAGVARDDLAPGVPRDTVKSWVRGLLAKTRAANMQELGLRVARDAFRHRADRARAGAHDPDLARIARSLTTDVVELLRKGTMEQLGSSLAKRERARRRAR